MNEEQAARRILVIDDEPNIAAAINAYLRKQGLTEWIVDAAPTMELGLARAEGAFVIIFDLTVPPSWTPETSPTLIPKLRVFAPVIVCTGYSDGTSGIASKYLSTLISEFGADGVILKNTSFGNDTIENLLLKAMEAQGRRLFSARQSINP